MTSNTGCNYCGMVKENLEYFKSLKVMIATPCYGGNANSNYMLSLTNLYKVVGCEHLDFVTYVVSNESLVTRARNTIINAFLDDKSFTHIFFIDADIGFHHGDVFRLLTYRKEVITGAYPMKTVDYGKTIGATTWQEAAKAATHYVINPVYKEGTTDQVEMIDGVIKVLDAGTGFMCIARSAVDKLVEAYGDEISYKMDQTTVTKEGETIFVDKKAYAIFDTSIEASTQRYLSEDYTFCRRWQSIGGDIWLDPSVELNHYGTWGFMGFNPFTPIETPSSAS